MGQDPEHGEGAGNLWCIDPTKRGDISAELAIDAEGNDLLHRRIQAVNPRLGERSVPNPNSGVIWNFREVDSNEDGTIDYEEQMHRSIASPVIKDGLLYIGDFSGIFYCLDASTGQPFWTHDCLSPLWGTALLVDGKVFVGDEDGDICVFEHSRMKNLLNEIYMEDSIKMTPIAVNDVLYIGTLKTLYAIRQDSDTTQK
jgi:outer membrane protein assembly factor BamB